MEDDRRTIKRTRVLRSAKIIVPRRSPVIHCTVQNINNGGACLKLGLSEIPSSGKPAMLTSEQALGSVENQDFT